MTPDALIIGGDGMIGSSLAAALRAEGRSVVTTTRRPDATGPDRLSLDLGAAPREWPALPQAPVWILCAAVARLGDCAADPDASRRVNVDAVAALAETGATAGAHVLFLSSDKVFDGTTAHRAPDDPPCPVTEYGRQKAEAERRMLALGPNAGVVRLTKVVGPKTALFNGWIESLAGGRAVEAFHDMTMAPVPLDTAVAILARAAAGRMAGILQVSGPRDVSYADAAGHIAGRVGAERDLVRATPTPQDSANAERPPRHTSLDTGRLTREFGLSIPDAMDVLDAVFALSTGAAPTNATAQA